MEDEIPEGAYLKDLSPTFNQHTIPLSLRNFPMMEEKTWGKVVVSEGEVNLLVEGNQPRLLKPEEPGIIPPGTRFNLECSGRPASFRILYFHEGRLKDGKELASLLGEGRA